MASLMDALLIDTDVFSFLFKGDTRADRYLPHTTGKRLCLSFMTVAELLRWALAYNWGPARRQSLDRALGRYLVLPYDAVMSETWARITVQRARAGKPISCGDGWIAASAVRHGLELLFHNGKDFLGIEGLRLTLAT